jgi:hypothetical protein
VGLIGAASSSAKNGRKTMTAETRNHRRTS